MPSGKTHTVLTGLTAMGVFGVGKYFHLPIEVILAGTTGCMAGIFIHPDLDQAESRKGPWYLLWKPYGFLIPHRSPLSHYPILGTLSRTLYIGLVIGLLVWLFRFTFDIRLDRIFWWALIGLGIADAVHFFADTISTSIKRL